MKTYNDVYLDARRKLKMAGVENFSEEAQLILTGAAGKTREEFFRDIKMYVMGSYEERVDDLIVRRVKGEPIAYITGFWEFYGLPIAVTRDVLIPRIDTEILVDKAIALLRGREEKTRVLDLCCGSGCVGLAIAANVPDSRVILVDNSLKALAVSRENTLKNHLTRNVTCIEADAMQNPPVLLGRFDMIVCNPPYIPSKDIDELDTSVKDFEPRCALDGGEDGLDFYRNITAKWKKILKDRGCLLFEVGIGQAEDVAHIMSQNGFTNISIMKDTLNIDRVVAGIFLGGN